MDKKGDLNCYECYVDPRRRSSGRERVVGNYLSIITCWRGTFRRWPPQDEVIFLFIQKSVFNQLKSLYLFNSSLGESEMVKRCSGFRCARNRRRANPREKSQPKISNLSWSWIPDGVVPSAFSRPFVAGRRCRPQETLSK